MAMRKARPACQTWSGALASSSVRCPPAPSPHDRTYEVAKPPEATICDDRRRAYASRCTHPGGRRRGCDRSRAPSPVRVHRPCVCAYALRLTEPCIVTSAPIAKSTTAHRKDLRKRGHACMHWMHHRSEALPVVVGDWGTDCATRMNPRVALRWYTPPSVLALHMQSGDRSSLGEQAPADICSTFMMVFYTEGHSCEGLAPPRQNIEHLLSTSKTVHQHNSQTKHRAFS